MSACWCGSSEWIAFNSDYRECQACHTLVYAKNFAPADFEVQDDEVDFYGKSYWTKHQQESFGYTDFETRTRADLSERNLFWLKALLQYKAPPARVLELGCAHGSFVALLSQAGFDASGLEMSPWIVEYATRTFDIPVLQGPLERHEIPAASIDVIILMDVIEHLPDPIGTMAHCFRILKPDGLLLIQTPEFKEGMEYSELVRDQGDFLEQLKPAEHLFLFSRESLTDFFKRLGAAEIRFLPALYDKYDMFCVVAPGGLVLIPDEQARASLEQQTSGRVVAALLDLDQDRKKIFDQLRISEADRADRLVQLEISEKDRDARFAQIEELTGQLEESEKDRDARFAQIEELTGQLEESEKDRDARFNQILELTRLINASEEDRKARFEQIQNLNTILGERESQIESMRLVLDQVRSDLVLLDRRPVFGWLWRYSGFAEVARLRSLFEGKESLRPKHVAIDLMPVLAGGENGGAKVFAIELIKGLVRLYPDCTFSLLVRPETLGELSTFLEGQNLNLVPIDTQMIADAPFSRSLLGRLKRRLTRKKVLGQGPRLLERGVDLLFCPFTDPTYVEPGLATVCTIHDLQYKTYPQFFAEEDVRHRDSVFLRAVEKSTLLAAVSDYTRGSAIQHGRLPHQKIKTVYHRLAHRIADRQDFGVLERLGLGSGDYLIYPANFWKHKNHEVLLTAFGLTVRNGLSPEVKLVLTGASGLRQSLLQSAAERMGLGKRTVFPGYVSNAELGALIQSALGVVFPSLYEGFGIPVIEAMGLGVPVACSNVTSLPEVAAGAALVFDPRLPHDIAMAMLRLANDGALRSDLLARGSERAALFANADEMAKEHMVLFSEALALSKPHYQLLGRYEDGWVGPVLWLQTEASLGHKTIEFEFSTRCWLPTSLLRLTLKVDGKRRNTYRLSKDQVKTISVSLGPEPQVIEWDLGEGYVPSIQGLGDDQRRLTLMLDACRVITEGEPVRSLISA
jgi:glycosyltransferase involved in cell wall biosynthesis/2-polyprenyl-3-methyl-5-hydroxy-6-metoxy-1,4-benzoquinol methylase